MFDPRPSSDRAAPATVGLGPFLRHLDQVGAIPYHGLVIAGGGLSAQAYSGGRNRQEEEW